MARSPLGPLRFRIPGRRPRAEVADEIAHHVDERAREYVARGMDPEEARAKALARFGDVERVRDACERELAAERRAERRRDGIRLSMLDLKLGLRMLARYPGLTVVGGLSMAFAIAVGALAFELAFQFVHPTLPMPDGDRIVAIRLWHAGANGVEEQALFDFARWRTTVESIEELGAYRNVNRNLLSPTGAASSVRVAEITASAFRLAGARPLLGRGLIEADERPDAASVLVIGERLWRTHFAERADIVGQQVRLGRERTTIVGVMPESFAFPVRHRAWAPLRVDALATGPREGSPIDVFGRLAPGRTLADAQAELTLLGQRAAAELPETHELLRPQVIPYARSIFPVSWTVVTGFAYSGQVGVLLFLALVCANVATLVFARARSRETEMAVRTALGASRGRIIGQVLGETLVLAVAAMAVGLPVAAYGLRVGTTIIDSVVRPLPFWVDASLSPTTVLYSGMLAALAAAVAGVGPALRVTGGVGDRLRRAGPGGGGLRFGRVWGVLIVGQVALTVLFLAVALHVHDEATRARRLDLGIAGEAVLHARLEMERATAVSETAEVPYSDEELTRFRTSFGELHGRIAADPSVRGVTYAQTVPGSYHGLREVEVEAPDGTPQPGRSPVVQTGYVGADYFEALGIAVAAGRGFLATDLPNTPPRCTGCDDRTRAVIVNETFVREILGGSNAVGRRVRYPCRGVRCDRVGPVDRRDEWYEIVGVVQDAAMNGEPALVRRQSGGLYHAWAPGNVYWTRVAIRVEGDAAGFAPRLREIAAAVDPAIRLVEVTTLDALQASTARAYVLGALVATIASVVVLMLSVAGTYAILAFAVSARTREIGIRSALGGDAQSIVRTILSSALRPVLLGVVVGCIGMVALAFLTGTDATSARSLVLPLLAPALMLAACTLACLGPIRRALRVEPTEALRAEA